MKLATNIHQETVGIAEKVSKDREVKREGHLSNRLRTVLLPRVLRV